MVVLLKNDSCIACFSLRSFASLALALSLFTSNGKYKYHGKRINWLMAVDEKEFFKKMSTRHAFYQKTFFVSVLVLMTRNTNENESWKSTRTDLSTNQKTATYMRLSSVFNPNKSSTSLNSSLSQWSRSKRSLQQREMNDASQTCQHWTVHSTVNRWRSVLTVDSERSLCKVFDEETSIYSYGALQDRSIIIRIDICAKRHHWSNERQVLLDVEKYQSKVRRETTEAWKIILPNQVNDGIKERS